MGKGEISAKTTSELLALVAHDLRNPLSALHSNLGFLRSALPSADEDMQDAIQDGMVSCDGLAHIIDNIDLLAQTLASGGSEASASFPVQPFVEEIVRRAGPVATSHGLEIECSESVEANVQVLAGREMLGRALSNLLRNSVQHAPSGSRVFVRVAVEAGSVVISIEDPGSILSPEAAAKAFTAAGQAEAKSMMGHGRYSRGLGLFAAAAAAGFGGAEVRVAKSRSGAGNRFELVAPLRQ